MRNHDIEKFLQHALPQELETLRLIGLDRVRVQGMVAWRSHFMPVESLSPTSHPVEFTTDMLWSVSDEPLGITFTTIASIAMPESARAWLECRIAEHNQRAPTMLASIAHDSGRFSVYASLGCEMSRADLELLVSCRSRGLIIERFMKSYESASESLFLAWKSGIRIGQSYRALS